jgi:indolepyruvate ferredoxin oxidoreductase
VAIELASIPEEIRGYGHVKERHLAAARTKWAALLARLRGQTPGQSAQVIPIPVRAA